LHVSLSFDFVNKYSIYTKNDDFVTNFFVFCRYTPTQVEAIRSGMNEVNICAIMFTYISMGYDVQQLSLSHIKYGDNYVTLPNN
jgi:hypothetical protein